MVVREPQSVSLNDAASRDPKERAVVHSFIYRRWTRTLHNASSALFFLTLLAGTAVARGPIGARDADYQMAVTQAHSRYRDDHSGSIPDNVVASTGAAADSFGVVVVRIDGKIYEAGDAGIRFAQSTLAAPFTAALAIEQHGPDVLSGPKGAVAGTVPLPPARGSADWGLAPTSALELDGSLATLSLLQPQKDAEGKWKILLESFGKFAGAGLALDQRAYRSDKPLVPRVPQIARDLGSDGRLADDAAITADLYLRQCALTVSARELAIMAATLANDGVNPVTQTRVISVATAQKVQAMLAAKRKGHSAWMVKAGIAGSIGNTGGIIVVLPGRLGLATYSPPLDAAGVSVRGQRAVKYLSQALLFNP